MVRDTREFRGPGVGLADTGGEFRTVTGVGLTRVGVEQREVPLPEVDVLDRCTIPTAASRARWTAILVPLSSRRLPLIPITCGVSCIVCLFVATAN